MGEEQASYQSDRTGLIVSLSIAGFIIFGPLTGIPAWIMANQDLRDLNAGFISPTASNGLYAGRIFAIIGTFCSPLWILVASVTLFVIFTVFGEMALTFL